MHRVSLQLMAKRILGTVIRSTGSWSSVMLQNLSVIECRLRGNYRIKGLRTTSPIAVGDKVELILEHNAEHQGIIEKIHERENYIIRKSVNLSKEAHIIASNIDQAVIIATVHQPRTSYGFIDRFLCTAEAYKIPACVFINKTDLNHSEGTIQLQNEYKDCYESIGYKVFTGSALEDDGIGEIEEWMNGKVTLVSGHSGVGKSTLINALLPELDIPTSEISEMHQKGIHTTTYAEMHPLKQSGFIIDTPGIKEFGMIDMHKAEVSHFFPEIFRFSEDCKFNNCRHVNEPSCAVQDAIKQNEIPQTRYSSYLSILESIK
ncbi:MAG: ribosome biogenesis GTPase [Bacteroidia bacterium]